ncbi:MAG: type II toxin-antitoxin system PemK/MazF family toxin [Clostridia bacterium]
MVLIRFPFTDLSTTKRRPAIVVSTATFQRWTHDLIVTAVTSVPGTMPSDFPLANWQAAGLAKPWWVRAGKLHLHESLVEGRLGEISERDWVKMRTAWDAILAPLRNAQGSSNSDTRNR